MIVKDMMPGFELYQPTQLDDALALLDRYGKDGWKMAPGNTCFADTPEGVNREHALFDTDRCVAVSPSDTAPALVALDAKMVIKSSKGERVASAEEFFIGPKTDITPLISLKPEEMLTAVRIPNSWAGAHFYFRKVADRDTWGFALVNVAAAIVVNNGVVERSRIACGGVSAVPRRLTVVEEVMTPGASST
jgi:xanthine dehydrogenase YagS FAD-binding subunit